jgi:glucose/arabinose dehydrogenase
MEAYMENRHQLGLRLLAAATIGLGAASADAFVDLPPEFQSVIMSPVLNGPVGMAFAPDGRIFVCEQRGVIRVVQNNAIISQFIDLQDEVGFAGDRGLLAIALDPSFNTNHYLYMAYTVDPEFGPPEESADEPAFARLVRYTGTSASNGNIADPASRTILIGDAPNTGFPVCNSTHTIGSLRWGLDGSLFLSVGDGAVWQGADQGGITPDCLQYEQPGNDIGAFRSQMLDSINGKILRIDPATGLGLPSNPYYNGDPRRPAIEGLGVRLAQSVPVQRAARLAFARFAVHRRCRLEQLRGNQLRACR